jgi:hypothetical protein
VKIGGDQGCRGRRNSLDLICVVMKRRWWWL